MQEDQLTASKDMDTDPLAPKELPRLDRSPGSHFTPGLHTYNSFMSAGLSC